MAAKDPTSHLNDTHSKVVSALLRFFRSKVEEHSQEMGHSFSDAKETRLLDSVFTKEDVLSVLDHVQSSVTDTLRGELEKYSHSTALAVRELLLQAEAHNVTLQLDTAKLDDASLLAGIAKLELEDKKKDLPSGAKKLASLGAGSVDTKLVEKLREADDAKTRLSQRLDQVQTQCKSALKENTELKETIAKLQAELATSRRDIDTLKQAASNSSSAASAAQLAELEQLRAKVAQSDAASTEQIKKLEKELKEAQDMMTTKISQSPQFKQLQKMVQGKNKQVRELRTALTKFDPKLAAGIAGDEKDAVK